MIDVQKEKDEMEAILREKKFLKPRIRASFVEGSFTDNNNILIAQREARIAANQISEELIKQHRKRTEHSRGTISNLSRIASSDGLRSHSHKSI
jgi:hypothetical protein